MMENYILLFGGVPELLQLRQRVLGQAGFKALATREVEAVRQLVRMHRVSLLVLSYSVSVDECEEALHFAHSVRPPLKTLTLGYGPVTACAAGHSDQVIDVLDGPEALLTKVTEMVALP